MSAFPPADHPPSLYLPLRDAAGAETGRLVRFDLAHVPAVETGLGAGPAIDYYRPVADCGAELSRGELAALGYTVWTSYAPADALALAVTTEAPPSARPLVDRAAADRPARRRRSPHSDAEALHVALGAAGYASRDHDAYAAHVLGRPVAGFSGLSPLEIARVRLSLLSSRRALQGRPTA